MRQLHLLWTIAVLIPAISLYTVVLGTMSLASTLLDPSGQFAHRCARAWSWLILKTSGVKVRVTGLEHLDASRSYVFAANHQSIYDIPVVFASLPFQLRIIAKASLGRIPFLGWHLHRAGHLLIDRSNPGAGVVKRMARLVGARQSLIVFPEGTRSVDGEVGRFKGGSFVIALDAAVPVVPISICGSRHVMTKGRLTVYPGEVFVTVHRAIETSNIPRDGVRALTDQVRAVIAARSTT
ncbi:MAG TPA: lysophospholipid acyltransferase family protein [Vicinamibacterales bacterium]|jgi:1-acyl-sn-glycerol-3-phosphate acyltransferase